jgi:hypothetical protein
MGAATRSGLSRRLPGTRGKFQVKTKVRITLENKEGVRYSWIQEKPDESWRAGEWEAPFPTDGYGSQALAYLGILVKSGNCPAAFGSSPPVLCRVDPQLIPREARFKEAREWRPRPGVYMQGGNICITADGEEGSSRAALRLSGVRATELIWDILGYMGDQHEPYARYTSWLRCKVYDLVHLLKEEKTLQGLFREGPLHRKPRRTPDESITAQQMQDAYDVLADLAEGFTTTCICICECDKHENPLELCYDCLFGDDEKHKSRVLTDPERRARAILFALGR